ncbi:hypothetical protein [Vibrio sonorensis]|uniref:hypothetical protein n=1 Tax=Vibrio sonorensis TaxID=1004316 RepID=UPI0008DB1F39|nr:hypothetical protein [Vibrio sonorensis]
MTNKVGVLASVTETFNVFNDGRQFNTAPQSYVLSALKKLASCAKTQERIKLGEAIGFYGHTIREETKKLKPREKEWIVVDGKAVEVRVEPAIRCTHFECDEVGNVTHTEEFLDTDDGKAALAAYKAKNGGFSWALGGTDGTGKGFASVARELAGFDYVFNPNFIPTDRRDVLLASQQDNDNALLLASVVEAGVEQEKAEQLVSLYANPDFKEASIDGLILAEMIEKNESLQKAQAQREMLLAQVFDECPYILSDEQKHSLIHMSTQHDAEIAASIFASMGEDNFAELPAEFNQPASTSQPSKPLVVPRLGGNRYSFTADR